MVVDRVSAGENHFATRIVEASLVVLCDGSALHARSVWRDTPVGEALARARSLVAVGASASVLGEVMIDPRGGAPTTGLGLSAAWRSVRPRMSTNSLAPGRCSARRRPSWCSSSRCRGLRERSVANRRRSRRDRESRHHIDDVVKVEFRTRLW